ncbi:MAG: nuclear transport factor 2 family protein [Candidatus Binataceae bacterium]
MRALPLNRWQCERPRKFSQGNIAMGTVNGRADLRHAEDPLNAVERIYCDWDAALAKNDVAALVALYAPDAVLESPLVPYLLGSKTGVCAGHDELCRLFEALIQRKMKFGQHYRSGFFSDGRTVIWEYPRAQPAGEQMDFVDVVELEDGLIQRHRVYWGWFSLELLKADG